MSEIGSSGSEEGSGSDSESDLQLELKKLKLQKKISRFNLSILPCILIEINYFIDCTLFQLILSNASSGRGQADWRQRMKHSNLQSQRRSARNLLPLLTRLLMTIPPMSQLRFQRPPRNSKKTKIKKSRPAKSSIISEKYQLSLEV
jgi:hypothetical protein